MKALSSDRMDGVPARADIRSFDRQADMSRQDDRPDCEWRRRLRERRRRGAIGFHDSCRTKKRSAVDAHSRERKQPPVGSRARRERARAHVCACACMRPGTLFIMKALSSDRMDGVPACADIRSFDRQADMSRQDDRPDCEWRRRLRERRRRGAIGFHFPSALRRRHEPCQATGWMACPHAQTSGHLTGKPI